MADAQKNRPKSISQQSSTKQASRWQESSMKKVPATSKQTTGWAELRMTKIEAKESSLRSSNVDMMQMVNSSAPSPMLRSKPPQQQVDEDDQLKNDYNEEHDKVQEEDVEQISVKSTTFDPKKNMPFNEKLAEVVSEE